MANISHKGTALVTGGAVRVGRALCLALAAQGYDVAVHYRTSGKAAAVLVQELQAQQVRATSLQADLTCRKQVASLITRTGNALGPLSLLVNSASIFEDDSVADFTDPVWDQHMQVHLHTPLSLAQSFVAQTLPQHQNQIINIIDQRVLALNPRFFSYTLSKSALWTATQTMAQSLGPLGIRVNAIGPGPTLQNKRQSDSHWQRQNKATLLGHGASPNDIAAAMVYLLQAKAVTGQLIAVDGGQHLAWETPDAVLQE